MKLASRLRKTVAVAMAVSMGLGGVVFTQPTEVQALENVQSEQKRNVMYYGDWSVWGGQDNFYPKDIPADQLTHLNFAFLDFDVQGNLIFTDKDAAAGNPLGQAGITWGDVNAGILPALLDLRAQNPNLKIGVSVGGWSKSANFSEMAANPTYRANFVENIMKFVEYTNMDFVDIDWEYPAFVRQPDLVDNKNDEGTPYSKPEDKENYILLLEDLRVALDQQGAELGKTYELSVALPAAQDKLEMGVDVKRMFEIIDFGNLMTYDLRGSFDEISGHQTALYANPHDPYGDREYTIDETIKYMLQEGAPAEKLVIGAAYYTRGWGSVGEGTDPDSPGLFGPAAISGKDADQSPSRGAINELPVANGDGGRLGGIWSYRNIDKLKAQYPDLKEYWDDHAKAPYLYSESTGAFFTYDNVRSIHEKADYVNEQDLGGMIAWMASNDAPTTSTKRDELTKATKEGLFGSADLPDHEIVYSDLDVTVSISPFSEEWSNAGGYEISITNNEQLQETGEVLETVEKMSETITLPKLYIKHTGPTLTKGDYTAGTVTQEDGYTVVDFGSIYDGKAIVPGQTYTFRLKTTGTVEDTSAIESIELVQRISKTGAEIERQTIYGNTEVVNQKPVLSGVHNKTITVGETFNALDGVAAFDKEDGDLTSQIKVAGTVNTEVAGTYTITYTVADSEGLQAVATRVITVELPTPNTAPVINGANNKTIKVGDSFNPLTGVTATDKEDGNLTSSIQVQGTVNTQVEGTYPLTYRVSDSEGLETTKQRVITVEKVPVVSPETPDSSGENYGVGEGIEWPEQVVAPFVDMAGWVTKPGYSNNGAPNLAKLAEDTGVKFYNLGFIQSVGGQINDDRLAWGWGGYSVLSENQNNAQYEGIKQSIRELREMGGDVTVSLGGLTGTAPWEATKDVDVLVNTYMDIVEGYGLTRLDLDIEGPAQDKAKNELNAKAIKRVQDATGVEIVLTLPVLPNGLTYLGLGVVEAYLEAGVDIELVNLMTMCYGPATLLPGENYGTASLRAVDTTKDQLQEMYRTILGQELSDEEAYGMLGTTTSIGFEGSAHPIFTKEWKQLVVDHANEKDLGMVSFWSINRDAQLESNMGINYQYEFTDVVKQFETDETPEGEKPEVETPQNQAPVINGATDVTIMQGDFFDPMEGVTATDKEDGNLTHVMNVEGSFNPNVPGTYTLTYTVTDSKGLETTVVRILTVQEVVVPEVPQNQAPVINGVQNVTITAGESFDKLEGITATDKEDGDLTHAIKVEGTVNTEVPGTYTLTYTVQDSEGLTTTATRTITVQKAMDPADPNNTYDPNKVYNTGDKVIYNGKEYTAKWWTQGDTPGQSDVWEVKKEVNPDGTQEYSQGTVYNEGDVVMYNGQKYTAKWWTTSVPGSDDSWQSEATENPDGSQDYVSGKVYVGGDVVGYNGALYEAKWWTTSTPGSDDSWNKL